ERDVVIAGDDQHFRNLQALQEARGSVELAGASALRDVPRNNDQTRRLFACEAFQGCHDKWTFGAEVSIRDMQHGLHPSLSSVPGSLRLSLSESTMGTDCTGLRFIRSKGRGATR